MPVSKHQGSDLVNETALGSRSVSTPTEGDEYRLTMTSSRPEVD